MNNKNATEKNYFINKFNHIKQDIDKMINQFKEKSDKVFEIDMSPDKINDYNIAEIYHIAAQLEELLISTKIIKKKKDIKYDNPTTPIF